MKKNVLNPTIITFITLLMGASLAWREADDGGDWGDQVATSPIAAAAAAEERAEAMARELPREVEIADGGAAGAAAAAGGGGGGVYESIFQTSERAKEIFKYLHPGLLRMLMGWRIELDKFEDPLGLAEPRDREIAILNEHFKRAIDDVEINPNRLEFRACPTEEQIAMVSKHFTGRYAEPPPLVGADELALFEGFFDRVVDDGRNIYDRVEIQNEYDEIGGKIE